MNPQLGAVSHKDQGHLLLKQNARWDLGAGTGRGQGARLLGVPAGLACSRDPGLSGTGSSGQLCPSRREATQACPGQLSPRVCGSPHPQTPPLAPIAAPETACVCDVL